jgi:pimeloyl-ACP methyl ester carboxylesterase
LILLHGWMDCAATFQLLADAAPEALLEYEWIAPDWRGFGQSAWASDGYWFPDYLADLDQLVGGMGDGAVTLVGHSMGGIVACLYAGIRPERVAALVSLEGFGLPATEPEMAPERYRRWLDGIRTDMPWRHLASMDEVAVRLCKINPHINAGWAAWLATQLARPVDGTVAYRADPRHKMVNPILYRLEEAQACWRQITARTLWLAGDEAAVLKWLRESPEQFARRKDCIDGLQYESLPNCGHNLHHDAPADVAARIAAFFGGAA